MARELDDLTPDEVFAAALRLPPEQRDEVTKRLLRVLADATDPLSDLDSESFEIELDRRTEELDAGRTRGMTVDEVKVYVDRRRRATEP